MENARRERRAEVARHPLRRRLLVELQARGPLLLADFATATVTSKPRLDYHAGELEREGWLTLEGDPSRARLRDDVLEEFPAAIEPN